MLQAMIVAHNHEDGELFGYLLRKAGMAVAASKNIQRVIPTLVERPIDLLLISTGEGSELVETVNAVRKVGQMPLIVLVDPLTEDAHCNLLDAGVDLVLQRPISTRLLGRYIHRLLRRTGNTPALIMPEITLDTITLIPSTRCVRIAGSGPQRLTQLEFRLLYLMMTMPGHAFTTEDLVEQVWGYDGEGNRGLVRGLVRRLRRKIEPNPEEPQFIENIPGLGYRFAAEAE